ncbi:hypothetical protein FHR24_003106 [Wenyingzhuangia heitensis]|uniref:DUF4868 domain-containing protein n=1 Tax=Wenyingzhuangia heitensis TaxID=1487859 RepID=A0ABX0UGV7_9FLAO|nr:anti-phage protein KwaB [Wenyingzhuangia heitensis]NIJ46616.1 hypothetical protein [Wenyingzhuangia heitensis]
MNKEELNQSLDFIITNPIDKIEISIFSILKENNEVVRLDIELDNLPQIIKLFKNSIQNNIIEKDDFSILQLSTADERKNCFYEYDLDLPEELKKLESVITDENIKKFNFKKNKIIDIDSLIIVLACGDKEISLFNKLSNVEILARGGYIIGKAKERFSKFNEQLLRISPKFQVIRISDKTIITNLETIEKSFGFQDVIKREADIGVNDISSMNILREIDSLREMISNVSFARKLTRIAKNSPVINLRIPNSEIINFARKHPATKSLKYTDDGSKFDLTTKKSKKIFLQLLNDDLLTSELTKLHYASLAKDEYEEDTED